MPIPAALRSRSRFRRWRSAAFSRLSLWLAVSFSLERFLELEGGVAVCTEVSTTTAKRPEYFILVPGVGLSPEDVDHTRMRVVIPV